MKSVRRCSPWGTAITILIIILIVAMGFIIFNLYNENIRLKKEQNTLNITINNQSDEIKKLQGNNADLGTQILQLQEEKRVLEEERVQLEKDKNFLQEEVNKEIILVRPSNNDFKSYMPYTAITNESSKQWKLQQQAYTNGEGIRCINGMPLVAIGTGWGLSVGDIALVTCDNGNNFKVVIGDIKANADTQTNNQTTSFNNCRCEFIVDVDKLNSYVKQIGNMAALEEYNGYVTNIEKLED